MAGIASSAAVCVGARSHLGADLPYQLITCLTALASLNTHFIGFFKDLDCGTTERIDPVTLIKAKRNFENSKMTSDVKGWEYFLQFNRQRIKGK